MNTTTMLYIILYTYVVAFLAIVLYICMQYVYYILCIILLLVEYSSIDWHDFVVVETINFRENETGQLYYMCIK